MGPLAAPNPRGRWRAPESRRLPHLKRTASGPKPRGRWHAPECGRRLGRVRRDLGRFLFCRLLSRWRAWLERTIPTVFGTRARRVSDMGLPAIANQTFRLIAHARLHQAVEQWEEKYPGVDIILLEPDPTDELMFGTPIMDYSRRLTIARHGFESVTATLAKDYERFDEIAKRHGLEISGDRVRRVVEAAEDQEPEQSAWRRVLTQTTSVLLRQSGQAS